MGFPIHWNKQQEQKGAASAAPHSCPHCAFVGKSEKSLKAHMVKKHGVSDHRQRP